MYFFYFFVGSSMTWTISLVVLGPNDGLLGIFFTKPNVVSKETHACALWNGEKSSSILPGQKKLLSV